MVGVALGRYREMGTGWLLAALAAGILAISPATAEERMVKAPRATIACDNPELVRTFHRLLMSGDNKASYDYLMDIASRPGCTPIVKGANIYLEQTDVLDKGIRGGIEDALSDMLSEALGFTIPTQAKIVRIRVAGEPTYYYTLLEFLL